MISGIGYFQLKNVRIDGIYNAQNIRLWSINRLEADKNGNVKKKYQFPTKVMD
jgi:hypothetical protein